MMQNKDKDPSAELLQYGRRKSRCSDGTRDWLIAIAAGASLIATGVLLVHLFVSKFFSPAAP
jgi:hypothetical protein